MWSSLQRQVGCMVLMLNLKGMQYSIASRWPTQGLRGDIVGKDTCFIWEWNR